jgi:hypothetical protein
MCRCSTNGETATLSSWVQELASVLGAGVVVSDDADGFKRAADEAGLLQHVGKAPVQRNTAAWVEAATPLLASDGDDSLAASGGRPSHAVTDVQTLLRLITERQPSPEASATLEALHRRYLATPKPRAGDVTSLAYRLASSAWTAGICGTA